MIRIILFITFFIGSFVYAQERTNYITVMPGSCSNCMAAIDLVSEDNNIFVFMESYAIDSNALRKKYTYLQNAKMLFSDKEFKNRSVNGYLMSISNENGSMKYDLRAFNKTAYNYFKLWNSNIDDTIIYSYPLSKVSIHKSVYTPEGKVYLLNSAENNIIVFDLLLNEVVDTVVVSEKISRDAYTIFNMNDTGSYSFYKTNIIGHIQNELCTIEDIAVSNDSLFVTTSNYFIYFGGEKGGDTFLTKFNSIHLYKNNEHKKSYVPTNLMQRLVDSSVKFTWGSRGLYVYNGIIYSKITNKHNFEKGFNAILAKYNSTNNQVSCIIKLKNDFEGDYNLLLPTYSKEFCLLTKSSLIFNLSTGEFKDLAYFKQSTEDNLFPEYMNYDFVVTDDLYKILYTKKSDDYSVHLATIDKNSNKIISNVKLEKSLTEKSNRFDPYNEKYLIGYKDNFKIIRSKIK